MTLMWFVILVPVVAIAVGLFLDEFDNSLIYNSTPMFKPRGYKVSKEITKSKDGSYHTFYVPYEKYITWDSLGFISNYTYYTEWERLKLNTPEECVEVLKRRQRSIGVDEEIELDF